MAIACVRTARHRRRPPSRPAVLACSACWLFASTSAQAQAGDAPAAEVLFREGRRALDAGNDQEACQKFAESERLDPAAGTLMNLATCEERLKKLAGAWQHWREAIDALQVGDSRTAFAQSRVRELDKRLPRLTVSLSPGGSTARVFRDDVELGTASQGIALPVDPGPHTVTVLLSGHRPESVAFRLAEAEEKKVDVRPGPTDTGASGSGAGGQRQMFGWALIGVGTLGLGTAVATGFLVSDKRSAVQDDCPGNVCRTTAGLDAAAAGRTLLAVNTAAWIIGALGLGAGFYFVLSDDGGGGSAALAPSVGPNNASLVLRGAF
jgi:hypothetical protein